MTIRGLISCTYFARKARLRKRKYKKSKDMNIQTIIMQGAAPLAAFVAVNWAYITISDSRYNKR